MVIETQVLPFLEWLPQGMWEWFKVVVSLSVATLAFFFLVQAVRRGPRAALRATRRGLLGVLGDLVRISPRRVWALTTLAVKESIRRRVVVVFAVFVVVLLFAGWFLDTGNIDPARLYLSFVLTTTSYLMVLLAVFLSAFSLPADIRTRTLHTVVTKPVRPSEIVLGRILGFAIIGSVLLAVMAAVSYVFVVRGLSHTHQLSGKELNRAKQAVAADPSARLACRTEIAQHHRHKVFIDADGAGGRVERERGHRHDLNVAGSGANRTYTVGAVRGMLLARVPIYGKLRFTDRTGKPAEKGINVGDEWTYRSYIEGGSLATAIWTFDGINERNFPRDRFTKGLPLEMTIGVFRTYKGDIERGIPGSLSVRNPKTGTKVEVRIFSAKEFTTDVQLIPWKLRGAGRNAPQLDLMKDIVADGKMEVWLRCVQQAQYFGMAQPDLYFRAHDASFELNFAKGYLGIWSQMILLIGFGVTFSTFLSGAVAMVATLGVLVLGFCKDFMSELAAGKALGGGPVEALIRLYTHQNIISVMDPGLRTNAAKGADTLIAYVLKVGVAVIPAFGRLDHADYVAYGFDITPSLILTDTVGALGFLLPLVVAGYLFLKMREVAR